MNVIFSNESKEKIVLAFIDSLQIGKIRVNNQRIYDNVNYDQITELKNHIKYLAYEDVNDLNVYYHVINLVYDCMLELRLRNVIEGEVIDKMAEQIIAELKTENESLKKENQRLYNENLLLANELRDRQNILESYEQPFTKKRDIDESK